ncbi:peptidase inhibitor family I36 protein [Streptomyces sp. JV176]|uniref:peptidase inhibitor family I36 protein n=1 Tax=Streptomyces sp. JV176 TaxID=858630 RepID=UPI002E7873AB|nr:peptidase inhibitor family I36 protein [Streptomyces sp. JV176]MEE1802263.1 peptidase inhibitor family I36 protein [Streptomyces sp. JV176]
MEAVIIMWRKTATTLTALVVTATGVVLAPTAAAAEPCPAKNLCLYAGHGYTSMKFQTKRSGACWQLSKYGLVNKILSYDNNMSKWARFYDKKGKNVWNIRNGGSSGDSSSYTGEWKVCTD